jgi:hypothetical protein
MPRDVNLGKEATTGYGVACWSAGAGDARNGRFLEETQIPMAGKPRFGSHFYKITGSGQKGHCVEVRALTLALTDCFLPAVTVVPGV